jgi:hypothetical protein
VRRSRWHCSNCCSVPVVLRGRVVLSAHAATCRCAIVVSAHNRSGTTRRTRLCIAQHVSAKAAAKARQTRSGTLGSANDSTFSHTCRRWAATASSRRQLASQQPLPARPARRAAAPAANLLTHARLARLVQLLHDSCANSSSPMRGGHARMAKLAAAPRARSSATSSRTPRAHRPWKRPSQPHTLRIESEATRRRRHCRNRVLRVPKTGRSTAHTCVRSRERMSPWRRRRECALSMKRLCRARAIARARPPFSGPTDSRKPSPSARQTQLSNRTQRAAACAPYARRQTPSRPSANTSLALRGFIVLSPSSSGAHVGVQ